ncbi:MAG: capsule biosynthesis GfcC family protein [Gammaproteobacteria bacterium]|nr:capsule biosynthesis GfcC family protein [Gammaproteobacteria bacterium]MBU2058462.1 capsule biosynthesis GfcC family protein [Gammaproteobacteria bacterium]MBU2176485.1 capsule biosynthesis GfcC family protein [Gammaproteobacteria bacterium]MBU2248573.1 capsule biosynthesis GfcC family protein [Gammaproteobacteria bacterium]MBU2345564.1 capsule biosynthesis GfcC family protein [Gammaproteobacteria bacterium]
MNRLSCLLFALAIMGSSVASASGPVVLVEHKGNYQGYFDRPRLGLVVSQLNTSPSLYWPAAQLFKVDVETRLKLEQQRTELLNQLAQLKQAFQQDSDSGMTASVEKLEKDISSWELAGNMNLALDPDRVRAKKSLNPLLSAGQYKLVVGVRPTELQMEGLVAEQKAPLRNAVSVDSYLDTMSILEGGSSSFVYVIPASGKFFIAKTGLWNKHHQEVLPGTVLFIPFEQRDLPDAFSHINEQIVELLLHKVVAQ